MVRGVVRICGMAIFLGTVCIGALLGYFCLMEGYCVVRPYLDTRMSQKFSVERAKQIRVGDEWKEVVRAIGEPLDADRSTSVCPGGVWYHFTMDGRFDSQAPEPIRDCAFCHGDFAWWGFSLCVDPNGRVSAIHSDWCYD